jgi:molybdenum cofactor biosynthesis enzyme MoaA
MKLEDIGFYTLSDHRANQSNISSPLWRCELVLTNACNFKCLYCRGLNKKIEGTMSFHDAVSVLRIWCSQGLRNVRFSGGEPTLYKGLEYLVDYCRERNVSRIAVSSNGSADFDIYKKLHKHGVNDFSISLDACCASLGDKMAGGVCGAWDKVTENIKRLAQISYTTVGVVINEENINSCFDTIIFADSLGVSDIRIVPSAQYNKLLTVVEKLPRKLLLKYPILRYRVNNIKQGRNVRGITKRDSKKCWLALDDMAVAKGFHYPCIIYMREKGNAIGAISDNVRKERFDWVKKHDHFKDEICRKNCLDVCIDYNNRVEHDRKN